MQIETTRHYPIPADAVLRMLMDRSYYEIRYRMSEDRGYQILAFEETGQGFLIRVRREIQVQQNRVPAIGRKLVGSSLVMTTELLWTERERQPFHAEYSFTFGRVPVSLRGDMWLVDEPQGCRQDIRILVSSHVPLVGRKLASLVSEKAKAGLEKDHEKTLDYIASHL